MRMIKFRGRFFCVLGKGVKMKIEFTDRLMKEFLEYKRVYQKYYGFLDEEMQSDDTIILNALRGDMTVMLDEMEKRKM